MLGASVALAAVSQSACRARMHSQRRVVRRPRRGRGSDLREPRLRLRRCQGCCVAHLARNVREDYAWHCPCGHGGYLGYLRSDRRRDH